MESSQEKTERILHEARAAFLKQDYPLALELYEWFFDHALDDPEAGFAAVRLSYCLIGWAELGDAYDPARASLERRRTQSIRELGNTREADKFHEFIAICELTGTSHLVVEQFLEYHRSDKDLARIIFGYAKEKLVADEQWEVCSVYIEDADREYAIALKVYDGAYQGAQKDTLFGEERTQICKNSYLSEVTGLISILTHARRFEEAHRLCERANNDMRERGLTQFLFVSPEDFED